MVVPVEVLDLVVGGLARGKGVGWPGVGVSPGLGPTRIPPSVAFAALTLSTWLYRPSNRVLSVVDRSAQDAWLYDDMMMSVLPEPL